MDSVIEQVREPDRFSQANSHIAQITGEQRVLKPTYYRHKKSGREFCYLAGGLGWPRDPKEKPGFAVVVAVDKPKTSDEKPRMTTLEEAEAPTVDGLLEECARLQKKYGHREYPDLFKIWYAADPDRSDTFVHMFNNEASKDPYNVYVVGAYDYEKPNAFERHVNQIFNSLTVDPTTGRKRLHIGGCVKLRNHIQNAPADVAVRGDSKDYPALSALGGLIHTLMMLMPWTQFLKPKKTIPTVYDPLTKLEDDYERAWWENESDDDQEYDTGELKPTCRY